MQIDYRIVYWVRRFLYSRPIEPITDYFVTRFRLYGPEAEEYLRATRAAVSDDPRS